MFHFILNLLQYTIYGGRPKSGSRTKSQEVNLRSELGLEFVERQKSLLVNRSHLGP